MRAECERNALHARFICSMYAVFVVRCYENTNTSNNRYSMGVYVTHMPLSVCKYACRIQVTLTLCVYV